MLSKRQKWFTSCSTAGLVNVSRTQVKRKQQSYKAQRLGKKKALTATLSPGSWALFHLSGCYGNADRKDGWRRLAGSWACRWRSWPVTGWGLRAGRNPPRSDAWERSLSRCSSPHWQDREWQKGLMEFHFRYSTWRSVWWRSYMCKRWIFTPTKDGHSHYNNW